MHLSWPILSLKLLLHLSTFVLETDGLGAILAKPQPDGTIHTLPMLLAPCSQLRLTMAYLS